MLRLRERRLNDLANVDLTNRLRLFLNKVDANCRGNQKEVLQSVIRGEQVVLQVASPMLVFVTPESAVSIFFMDYVSKLTYSHKLDRIVLDECHSVIFGGEDFRPKFHDIKNVLQCTGVPVMLLTATLPKKFEIDLIKFLGLQSRSD